MKNYLQLEIDGKIYGLKFNIGTCNIVKELTGQDPFKYAATSEDYSDVLAWAKSIFWAALLCNHRVKKEDTTYTSDEIDALMIELTPVDIQIISDMWSKPADSKPSLNGEVSKHTQSGDHVG